MSPAGLRRPFWVALLLLGFSVGTAQSESWELNFCAEPANLPFSNEKEEGFENEIARIVADELGAELSYTWLPRPSSRYREIYLRSGRCDAVMGVADGDDGFLTSLSYYRSTYVFVYRSDSGVEVESLDGLALQQLSVAVSGGGRTGPERLALAVRGLTERQLVFEADFDSPEPHSGPIDAVVEGRADLAIAWGPVAGYAARSAEVPLDLVPVPQPMGRAFLPMVIPISMGVRPHDVALRDMISRAIANRWEEIRGVLEAYGVPLEPLPRPALGARKADGTGIGLVLPTPTGAFPIDAAAPHAAAVAALQGAILAQEDAMRSSPSRQLETFWASAPSAEAARRAAERLVLGKGVFALVGGLGEGQASELRRVAEEHDVLFFDVGHSSSGLGAEEPGNTFHLDASSAMYLDAIARTGAEEGVLSWFLVVGESERELTTLAEEAIKVSGGTVSGRARVAGTGDYQSALEGIRSAAPDAVLLLLDWRAQIEFLGLFDAYGLEPKVTGMPHPMTQTRTFYLALERVSVEADALQRIALWEPGLEVAEAKALGEHYFGRWGVPMEAPAWAGYQALSMLFQIATRTGSTAAPDLVAYLEDGDARFEVAKGTSVGFDPSSHRLLQPLYLVRVEPDGVVLAELESVIQAPAR